MISASGARLLGDAEGDVAGAAGDVEMAETRAVAGVDLAGERVLPQPVQAAGHQIVHHVVAAGDLVEHVVDEMLLLGQRHLGIAEMGRTLSVGMGIGHLTLA